MKKLTAALLAVLLVLSLAACGSKTKNADLKTVLADMKKTMTNTEMMDLTLEEFNDNYGTEIDAGWVKQSAIYVDSTGMKGDEVILLEAKDADSVAKLEEQLESRYSQKESEMRGYLPEEFAVLEKCKIKKDGNYISLIVSPQYEELNKIYNSAIK